MMQAVRRAAVGAATRGGALKQGGAAPLAQSARGFADEAKKEESEEVAPGVYRTPTAEEVLAWNETKATPGFSEDLVTPAEPKQATPPGAQKGWEGYVNWVPDGHKDRKVRIYKQSKNASQMEDDMTKYWSLNLDRRENWTNQLMKYASSGDPLGATGLQTLKFDKLEDATAFCERQGWKYEVDEPLLVVDQEGEKQYAQNFLNYHVRSRREKMPPNQLMNTQFFHREGRKPAWVNLKHSNFGKMPSKTVSATHWTDPHPNNHKATDWYMRALKDKQELARKLGK
ncbi:NADH dehydrogenase ubiquinone iron-sulfur protein 4, mitochondrial [Hondaea fermentalgiana]|uniref:NADH dehydrogenase [ubiquinone] iron-sulfur protein 4, mitochondrial n=1 Tax=Hondaea fermentalgiana TaxID=2315210 RepID=A0A2R5GA18_9STRA|nr:NADH dehydrogenase ubiquinone iron-sulfur protein 4, mitochondrial [Hondaea fermentalgiana]|eukprot:GBG24534.1 NADH dehydrogenase ubiquinone iron-sulfur protein 4, mitochondrial [Hondaea fermentalgiana]